MSNLLVFPQIISYFNCNIAMNCGGNLLTWHSRGPTHMPLVFVRWSYMEVDHHIQIQIQILINTKKHTLQGPPICRGFCDWVGGGLWWVRMTSHQYVVLNQPRVNSFAMVNSFVKKITTVPGTVHRPRKRIFVWNYFPNLLSAKFSLLLFLFQTGMLLTMTQVIWLKVAAAFWGNSPEDD